MAITPTTWNPSDKGYNVTLSNGDLTTSYSNYSQNRVRSIVGVTTGKWYWEVTLDSADDSCYPMLGATARSISVDNNTQEAGELYVGTGGFAPGDVFGVAFDADAGTIDITRNGVARASVSGLTVAEAWHPSCGGYDYGTLGGTTAFTVNFGSSAFAHTPPAGFTAGIGEEAYSVTGFCGTVFGAPSIDYPPIVKGFNTTAFGTPAAQQKFPVDSLLPTSRFGAPHLKFDQIVQVDGFNSTRFGTPRLAITMPGDQHQICSVTGFRSTQFGAPVSVSPVSCAVMGFNTTQFGTPTSGQGHPVTGFNTTQFGTPINTQSLGVQGFNSTRFGAHVAVMRLPVAGFNATRFGVPTGHAASVHSVSGFCTTQFGTPSGRTTHLVRSLPPTSRFGTPTLQANPC